jgi:hypothetical protein
MKLFGRSSGYYLFWTGFVYFWVGMYFAFTHYALPEIATLGFVLALSVPLWCPPVARYFNMEPLMFDFFKKRDYSNVVKFPEQPKAVPYIEPPKEKEKPAHTYYRLGLTDNNRVSFTMGYSEITMNAAGVDSMIKLLETYRNLLNEEHDSQS